MNPTPSRKELTHERIVNAASAIIRRTGYAGTGVADIMKEAGLTHGGFYAHFDSRTQLLAEAADRGSAKSLERLRKAAEGAAPEDALQVFVDTYLSDAHAESPGTGCSLAALGTEMPRQAPEVRQVCARRLKDMVALVEQQLELRGEPEQHGKALAILSCLVGAMVLARAGNDKRFSKDVRGAARAFIETGLN